MKNVEDIYPVSPMQEVMLLHSLSSRDHDTLFNQFCFAVDEAIDIPLFQKAWDATIARHPALRTAFVWENVARPLQVVRRRVEAEFEILDWRNEPAARYERLLEELLVDDRKTGFDPRRAPLMRFALCQLSDRSSYFVWSNHHLILDRWCLGVVLKDVGAFYSMARDRATAERGTAPSFRAYIDWIQRQEPGASSAFWQEALEGFERPTRVATESPDGWQVDGTSRSAQTELNGQEYAGLARFAGERALTMSAVVQGAWALTMNQHCTAQDVVFGATVAGRPAEVHDVDEIVGSFINNVPVRVRMPESQPIAAWLRELQEDQFRRSAADYASPAEIRECSELADGEPLFDTLMVWLAGADEHSGLPLRPISAEYGTAYPVTLSVDEAADRLTLRADLRDGADVSPETIVNRWRWSLLQLCGSNADATLGELPGFCRDPDFAARPRVVEGSDATVRAGRKKGASPIEEHRHGRESLGAGPLVELLTAEWQRVLGTDTVGAGTDFFDAGGDSLQAAQLHAAIEKATRTSVPMLTLFEHATVEGMADTLSRGDWPLMSDMSVGIRMQGEGAPLFCIASPEVNTIGYALLARHLPAGQRVCVLQAPPDSQSVRRLKPSELPVLADDYLEEMQEIQPEGPYSILAMCTGAHIALEMTRRLESRRAVVDFLGIINTWGLYTVSRSWYLYRATQVARYLARRLFEPAPPVASAATQGSTVQVVLPPEYETGGRSPWIHEVGFESCDPRMPKISTRLTVLRNDARQPFRIRDEGLGWSKQASEVDVVRLPGDDHEKIMREPWIRDLADAVAERLAKKPEETR